MSPARVTVGSLRRVTGAPDRLQGSLNYRPETDGDGGSPLFPPKALLRRSSNTEAAWSLAVKKGLIAADAWPMSSTVCRSFKPVRASRHLWVLLRVHGILKAM